MTDTTPGTDVAYLHSSLQERKEYAAALAAAGELVPSGFRDRNGAANPAKLLLAFETGSMLGLHPLAALQGIHVIEGKPTISAGLMSGLVRAKGHKLRIRSTGSIEDNTYTVTATLIRRDDPDAPFTATWNIDRARRAELFGKNTWRKFPEAMLEARAISEVCRKGAQDALSGLVYTPEEFGAEVNEDGDIVDGEIVEDEPPTPPKQAPASNRGGSVSRPPAAGTSRQKQPVPEPSEEQVAAVAEFADAITETDSVNALRVLHGDADKAGLLPFPTREGVVLGHLFRARKAFLERRETEVAEEDVPLDLDEPS